LQNESISSFIGWVFIITIWGDFRNENLNSEEIEPRRHEDTKGLAWFRGDSAGFAA
jgi:hypothetical protein